MINRYISFLGQRRKKTLFLLCGFSSCLYQQITFSAPVTQQGPQKNAEIISFSFEKKRLVALLDDIAARKNRIIIYPTGQGLEALKKQLVTYHPPKGVAVTVDYAWHLLVEFLDLSGFSLIHKKENTYALIDRRALEGASNRETLDLYVNSSPQQLPSYPEPIRYLYDLGTLKVPLPSEQAQHPLTTMLTQLLSSTASLLFNPTSNSILITDKAPHIASVIPVLDALEAHGFSEQIDYIPLHYISAQKAVDIFDSLRKASGEAAVPAEAAPTGSGIKNPQYFAQDTRIIAHESNNALIVMGSGVSVERISDFIRTSLDQAPESGNSILHIYDLQYLDAQEFAPYLQRIVSGLREEGQQAAQTSTTEGFERSLQGVQVSAEGVVEVQKPPTTEKELLEKKGGLEVLGIEGVQKIGGNRLIIAATQDQWAVVKQLIEKLDTPRKQVILEIYVVDFTYENQTIVSSDLRNPTDVCSTHEGLQFLASHISPVSNVLGATPQQLAQDLLQLTGPDQISRILPLGSTLISFNDPATPGILGLLQLLQRAVKVKIVSHPYLVITDHQTGTIESEEIRFIQGNLVTTTNGTFTIPLENVSAALRVVATPHLSSDSRLRLEVSFTADEFISTNSNTRLTRELRTTATLSSGQILAMGGLLRSDTLSTETYTPILGKIPLAGIFFRGENRDDTVTNITLLASPIIIEPRKSQAIKRQQVTEKAAEVILYENRQENLRDPLYNLFFKGEPTHELMNEFLSESSNMQGVDLFRPQAPLKLIRSKTSGPVKEKPFHIDRLKELLSREDFIPSRTLNRRKKYARTPLRKRAIK